MRIDYSKLFEGTGPNCEVYSVLVTVDQSIFARLDPAALEGYGSEVHVEDDEVIIYRFDGGLPVQLGAAIISPQIAIGDKVGLKMIGDLIGVYVDRGAGWEFLGIRKDGTYRDGGHIAVDMWGFNGESKASDDFSQSLRKMTED